MLAKGVKKREGEERERRVGWWRGELESHSSQCHNRVVPYLYRSFFKLFIIGPLPYSVPTYR